jgi:hypothetical protein
MKTYTFSLVYIYFRLIILWNWKRRNYAWECFAYVDLQDLIFSQKYKVLAFVVMWSNPGLFVLVSAFPWDFSASFLSFCGVHVDSNWAHYFLCCTISVVNLRDMRNTIDLLWRSFAATFFESNSYRPLDGRKLLPKEIASVFGNRLTDVWIQVTATRATATKPTNPPGSVELNLNNFEWKMRE